MSCFDYNIVKNPEIFEQMRLPAHSDHMFVPAGKDLEAGLSDFRVSLNGIWKFMYASNYESSVKDFYREDTRFLTAEEFADTYGEYPVDKNDPEESKTAVFYDTPEGFSRKAKATLDYLDDTAWIFAYKDKLVVTDESLYLTNHGNGTHEAPYGGPRAEFDSWEELEAWLEQVYDENTAVGIMEPVEGI